MKSTLHIGLINDFLSDVKDPGQLSRMNMSSELQIMSLSIRLVLDG